MSLLSNGCSDPRCVTATLTRRETKSGIAIYLQCDRCGDSIGGPLARRDICEWQSLSEWRQELKDAAWAEYEAERDAVEASRIELIQARNAEAQSYLEWCQTSPEWHYISGRVLERAGGVCEACLTAPAEAVHHRTYSFGKLPPAWHLVAVCRACHSQLHADKHSTSHEWCIP